MRDTLLGLTTVVILFGVVYMTQTKSTLPKKIQNKKVHAVKINKVEEASVTQLEIKKENKETLKTSKKISNETISISMAEKRAQMYIDRDWMPDENIDKDTYLRLGGRYTKYWDTSNKENTNSTTPPNNTQGKVISN